jgi:molybdenum cofactor biosynthesis protein B
MSNDPQLFTLSSPHPNDKTTPAVKDICDQHGITLIGVDVVSDNKLKIQLIIQQIINEHHPDILITSGGTGISPSDQTPEAILPFFEKPLRGFEIVFHNLSFQEIGAATILGRSTAGIYENTPIFLLPGSPSAVTLALERIIIPEATHILAMIKTLETNNNE